MSLGPTVASPATPVLTLLTRMALAIARHRSYGPEHPMVLEAEQALADTLIPYIEAHSSFALAVANRDLLVDGEVMPSSNAVVRDIATRLHLLGIGAIRCQRGLTRSALSTLLALLARRPGDDDDSPAFPDMQGIIVARIDYEQLGLTDEATLRAEGESLWRALASRAHAQLSAPSGTTTPAAEGDPLSELLSRAAADPQAAAAAFTMLSDLAERIAMTPRTVRHTVGERLDALFTGAGDAALVATLRAAPAAARLRFSSTMVDVLPGASMLRWLSVVAEANGRDLSPHMLRIITKMSAHQDAPGTDVSDQSLRETVLELVQGWDASDMEPEDHHHLLETLAVWTAHDDANQRDEEVHLDPISREAIRLVQMACEIDYISADASQAARHLADHGLTAQLLEWATQAPSEETRHRLQALAITPEAVSEILLTTPFDADAAKSLLEAMSDAAAVWLIDPLEHCESRTGRRLILNRLRNAGAAIDSALRERLMHPMPWYLARNLLGVLRDIADAPRDGVASATLPTGALLLLQSHEHVQVRREAVRALAQYAETRTASLRRALDDADDEVRVIALDAILSRPQVPLPRELLTRLLALADDETLELPAREKAIRAASMSSHPEVRAWLVAHCTRRGLIGGLKLAPLTPLVRTGLQQLALYFADHDEVKPIVARARREGLLGATEKAP